jgi:hypothetical protein
MKELHESSGHQITLLRPLVRGHEHRGKEILYRTMGKGANRNVCQNNPYRVNTHPPYTMFVGVSGRLFYLGYEGDRLVLFEVLGEQYRKIHVY